MTDWEQCLLDCGWPIEEQDFGTAVDPEVMGCLLVKQVDDGLTAKVALRPGVDDEVRATFAEWACSRILRFVESGPEPDGWQRQQSDDAWQLWGRFTQMPLLD